MTPRRYRIVAARRLHDGTAALWRTSTVRHRAAIVSGTAITVLKIAPHNHTIIAIGTAAWAAAAWRAGHPDRLTPTETPIAPTSDDSGQKGKETGGGAGMSILNTPAGPATLTDDPHDPARTNITWKKP